MLKLCLYLVYLRKSLFDAGKRIAPKILMFLPRNVDINQLAELSLSAVPPWSLEVPFIFLFAKECKISVFFCFTLAADC